MEAIAVIIPLRAESGSDAVPIGTIAVVAANALVFAAGFIVDPHLLVPGMLAFGSLHPHQWITSLFLHADAFHLLGNMLFLWIFGLLVEAVCGAWKFVALFLISGALASAFEQVLLLDLNPTLAPPNGPRYALGASGAIFGLAAAALLWAPTARVAGVYMIGLRLRPFRVKARTMVIGFILWEVAGLAMRGFENSSELSHVTGAVFGWLVAYAMLKFGWVNTEGWDLLSEKSRRKAW